MALPVGGSMDLRCPVRHYTALCVSGCVARYGPYSTIRERLFSSVRPLWHYTAPCVSDDVDPYCSIWHYTALCVSGCMAQCGLYSAVRPYTWVALWTYIVL